MNIQRRPGGGFALVLTMSLVALMVLSLFALVQLTRVSGQISTTTNYQVQANQHARLGLAQAIATLQKYAGPDQRATAMAGIAGVTDASPIRHWCGVWAGDGSFVGWLTSGALASPTPSLGAAPTVTLVERKSVGPRPFSLSAYADEEYVDAGKVPVLVPGQLGAPTLNGFYAYWVGDEGVKISAVVPAAELPPHGRTVGITSTPINIARMGQAYHDFDYANAGKILAYEQSTHLSYASGSRLTAANLHDSFHHVTLTHRSVDSSGATISGLVNINTNSVVVWRSLLESYDLVPGVTAFTTAARRTTAINTLANGVAETTGGKSAYSPYLSIGAFLNSSFLEAAITGGGGITVEEFSAALGPMLTVRSDTFRIRAYGDAVNRVDSSKVEAVAQCEAIVQRTSAYAPNALGRRFVVTYFRWLGPDDI